MSVNSARGEIEAALDGRKYRLCLTLGALAELETAFGAASLAELLARFNGERLSATDMIRILGAGLRAGGTAISDAEVAAMQAEGGAAGFARIVARLLTASFGNGECAANP